MQYQDPSRMPESLHQLTKAVLLDEPVPLCENQGLPWRNSQCSYSTFILQIRLKNPAAENGERKFAIKTLEHIDSWQIPSGDREPNLRWMIQSQSLRNESLVKCWDNAVFAHIRNILARPIGIHTCTSKYMSKSIHSQNWFSHQNKHFWKRMTHPCRWLTQIVV